MKQRIITGVVLAAIFLTALHVGGVWFTALILAMAMIGFHEFLRITGIRALQLPAAAGFAGILMLFLPRLVPGVGAMPMLNVAWLVMLLLLVATVLSRNRIDIKAVSLVFIGFFYIGIGFSSMVHVRLEDGLFWSYFLYACIWVTDIGAYFAGVFFGKHKMWPEISPKKTWEGSAGGAALAVATAAVFSLLPQAPDSFTLPVALGLGLLISVAGQMGDLIQSAYKRAYGVKDSGTLFPGHGGVLDRTDSWIIVFPLMQLLGLLG